MKLKIFLAALILCSLASMEIARADAPVKVADSACAATCTDGYNNFAKDCLGEKPNAKASLDDKLAYQKHATECDDLSKNYYKDCLSACPDQKK